MVAIERHYQLAPQSTTQRRFRQKWFIDAWDNPEPRVDAAYFAIVAWMPGVSASRHCKRTTPALDPRVRTAGMRRPLVGC